MTEFRNMIPCLAALLMLCCAVAPADPVTFNYQGQVKVQGQRFTGTGQFKFAILNTSATATLWSNDGTASGEPTAFLTAGVSDGVFSIEIGGPGMTALDSGIFAAHEPLRLRTWFCDGVGTFEQLNPDNKLSDISLNTIETGASDYTIYVSTTGNDANNGLSIATAKKTVGGAIDIIPSRVRCNLTVKILPGTYREGVGISNISVKVGKKLKFLGDETWSKNSAAPGPNVRISAASNDNSPAARGALSAFEVDQCARLVFQGLQFDGSASAGLNVQRSEVTVQSCRGTSCSLGMLIFGGYANVYDSVGDYCDYPALNNSGYGFHVGNGAQAWMYNIRATNNGYGGMRVNHHSTVFLPSTSQFTNNGAGGVNVYSLGEVVLTGPSTMGNNVYYNVWIDTGSIFHHPENISTVGPAPSWGSTVRSPSAWWVNNSGAY